MSAITMYGLKRCSTCVKAVKWLQERGVEHEFIDYRDEPVAATQLQRWSQELGAWEKLVNRASMTWRNLPESRKSPTSDQQWQDLVAEFPTLIKRPVLQREGKPVAVGFSEKKYAELLG